MASIKVAKDYIFSSQNSLLIGDDQEQVTSARRMIQIGTRRMSAQQADPSPTPLPPPPLPARQPRVLPRPATVRGGGADHNNVSRDRQRSPAEDGDRGMVADAGGADTKFEQKQWTSFSDELQRGFTYRVKFLGECLVEQPKGTEVVKDAVRKMQFNKHIKRAEGQKPPKMDLVISTEGITVQDQRSKTTLYYYPLHKISYCADDKYEKEMFAFIARESDNKHYCYVFKSGKFAEEMALKVGQAFDIAYKRFLGSGSRTCDIDYEEKCVQLQNMIHGLQLENEGLKRRVEEVGKLKDRSELEHYMKKNQLTSLSIVAPLTFKDMTSKDENAGEEDQTDEKHSDDKEENVSIKVNDVQVFVQQPTDWGQQETLLFDIHAPQVSVDSFSANQPSKSTSCPPQVPTQMAQNVAINTDPWGNSQSVARHHSGFQTGSRNPFADSSTYMGNFSTAIGPSGLDIFSPSSAQHLNPFFQERLCDAQVGSGKGPCHGKGKEDFSFDDFDPLNRLL